MQSGKVQDLINLVKYLEKSLNVIVSIHFKAYKSPLSAYANIIAEYNSHRSDFCMAVKGEPAFSGKCIECQRRVFEKLSDKVIFGTCAFGLQEFVVPVMLDGKVVGMICVGAFCFDAKKAKGRAEEMCKKYGVPSEVLRNKQDLLQSEMPDIETVKNVFCAVANFVSEILRNEPKRAENNVDGELFSEIVSYIRANFRDSIKVRDIARFCCCSESGINHTFKKISGVSVSEYTNRLRVENIKRMLESGKYNVTQCSQMCGFSNPNYMSLVFKAHTGLSPKAYKKSIKN